MAFFAIVVVVFIGRPLLCCVEFHRIYIDSMRGVAITLLVSRLVVAIEVTTMLILLFYVGLVFRLL